MSEAARLVAAIAAFGLDDAPTGAWTMSPTRDEWLEMRGRLVAERLTGMAALLHGKGVLRLDDESTEELAETDARWSHHTLAAEDVLLSLATSLDEAGIPFRALKGTALAELTWQWGEARRWVDADVLVPSDRLDAVVSLCLAAGATRPVPELRPGFDHRFAKSVTLRSAAGPEIDLHRAITPEPYLFVVPIDDLWDSPREFVVEGTTLRTLSPDATLLHACLHATIGGNSTRLASLRDAVEAFAACDRAVAADLAERWKAREVVRDVAARVSSRLELPDHEFVRWAGAMEPSAEEHRLMDLQRSGEGSQRQRAMASLRLIPGVVDKVRYAAAFAWPSAENRAHRGRSVGDQMRRVRRR